MKIEGDKMGLMKIVCVCGGGGLSDRPSSREKTIFRTPQPAYIEYLNTYVN